MTTETTTLWLLPAPLSEDFYLWDLYQPRGFQEILLKLKGLFAETPKVARGIIGPILKTAGREIRDFSIEELSEHTTLLQIEEYVAKITKEKGDWGLISDAGLALIADPGKKFLEFAKAKGITIQTLGGASSITSALQLSGKTGQKWMFHGYFPTEEAKLKECILFISKFSDYTHIFIETPYRNQKQLKVLTSIADPKVQNAFLGVYIGLFSKKEERLEMKLSLWKNRDKELPKEPAVFVLSF